MIYQSPGSFEEQCFCEEGLFGEIEKWNRANQDPGIKKYKNTMLTDEEYREQYNNLNIMQITDDYPEYKQAFTRLCYFCHIVPRGVIIRKIEIKKGKNNKNSLYMEYTYNTKRIDLPEGTVLYHVSSVAGIKELNPAFKGKTGYFYDKPRVYFTIRRKMPKAMADYKGNVKMHMYMCKQKLRNVFVDPLLWGYASGAVYVESNKPIKVEEIDPKTAEVLKKRNDDALNENTNFNTDSFVGFATMYGSIPVE